MVILPTHRVSERRRPLWISAAVTVDFGDGGALGGGREESAGGWAVDFAKK